MNPTHTALRASAALLSAAVLAACGQPAPPPAPPPIPAPEAVAAAWKQWSGEFHTRSVQQVTEGVHVAIGYGLATSVMLSGPDGRIIVDTLETPEAAAEARAAFDAIDDRPIRAIIYTHAHPDHTGGTAAFTVPGLPIHAHALHHQLVAEQRSPAGAVYRVRAMRQFGLALPEGSPGRFLRLDPANAPVPVPPNHTFEGPFQRIAAAGIELELHHAPGESMDQIVVWWPERRVLLCGDNVYPSFPNLYTLRGEPSRDVYRWRDVLHQLRAFSADHLVPGHGPPLSGRDTIRDTLLAYGDAIQYVHDQTLRGVAMGEGPDQLAARIRLPKHLAEHPWLQEAYGRVDWGVRTVYAAHFGFFDGDAASLYPHDPADRAARLARLAGGTDALGTAMREALQGGDPRWALELAGALLQIHPDDPAARAARADALDQLAAADSSVNAHNYAVTQAREARGDLSLRDPVEALSPQYLATIPVETVFRSMATRLRAEDCLDTDETLALIFPDIRQDWTIHIRRGIADIRPGLPEQPDYTITIDAADWKGILAGGQSPALTLLTRGQIQGNPLALRRFLQLFQP